MNRYKIGIAAAVWVLLWAGSIWLYEKNMLEQPLFFRQYAVVPCSDDRCEVQLNYLVNRNQKLDVIQIHIPGVDNLTSVRTYADGNVNKYQDMRIVHLSMPAESLLPTSVKQLEVTFENGSRQNVSIGELQFIKEKDTSRFFHSISSSGSSDGRHSLNLKAIAPVSITGITISPPVLTAEDLQIMLNGKAWGKDQLPLRIASDEFIKFTSFFNPPAEDPRGHSFYRLRIFLQLQTESGQSASYPIYLNLQPHISEKLIHSFIGEKGL